MEYSSYRASKVLAGIKMKKFDRPSPEIAIFDTGRGIYSARRFCMIRIDWQLQKQKSDRKNSVHHSFNQKPIRIGEIFCRPQATYWEIHIFFLK